jgi:predicted DNA binding CopG/RHH family protein
MATEKKKIPRFKTEEEAAAFWETHSFADYIDSTEEVEVEYERPERQHISMRIEKQAISEIKEIAREKGMGYQTLMRSWIMERLADEKNKAHRRQVG